MKNKIRFYVSFVIMIVALLCMGINWLIVSIPDWAIRTAGIVILVDLVILSYSTIQMKQV